MKKIKIVLLFVISFILLTACSKVDGIINGKNYVKAVKGGFPYAYEEQGISYETIFDKTFENVKWAYKGGDENKKVVEFTAKDSSYGNVKIKFKYDIDKNESEIIYLKVGERKFEEDSIWVFISLIFEQYFEENNISYNSFTFDDMEEDVSYEEESEYIDNNLSNNTQVYRQSFGDAGGAELMITFYNDENVYMELSGSYGMYAGGYEGQVQISEGNGMWGYSTDGEAEVYLTFVGDNKVIIETSGDSSYFGGGGFLGFDGTYTLVN